MLKNVAKHLKTIIKHKWYVFKLCVRAGIPWRGIMHDWSKFSPTELKESIHYYQGHRSPITACKEDKGYSEAWLHHKGRNKHHYEYWYDADPKASLVVMPYQYTVEMICDTLAAGMVYNGKNWTTSTQLEYWNKSKAHIQMHPKIHSLLTEVYTQVKDQGIDKTITPKNLKALYQKHTK